MIQAKFSLKKSHLEFIKQCKQYGFKDKSELARTAIDRLSAELDRQRVQESAALYAEAYAEDRETQDWTEAALSEWPT